MKLNANTKDTEKYLKKMQEVPGMMRRAVASTLNTQAFAMKNDHIQDALDDLFEIRSPKFFANKTRVKMAKKAGNPDTNFSVVGMMDGPRFTGLEEQQEGKVPEKKRTATVDVARGGSFAKKQRPTSRLNKPKRRQSQYQGRSKKHRMFQMFRETRKQKLNMLIPRGDANIFNMPPGLYGWRRNRLMMLQSFEPPKAHRAKWMDRAVGKLFKKQGPQIKVFEREVNRVFKGL